MFGNRIPSKSNNCRHADVLCLLFCVSDRLIYDIFNFGIRVPNMIDQKLKTGQSAQHELFNKVRLEKLPYSFKFSLHTYFVLGRYGRLTPWGGARRFFCNLLRDCPPNFGMIRYCNFYRGNRKTNV